MKANEAVIAPTVTPINTRDPRKPNYLLFKSRSISMSFVHAGIAPWSRLAAKLEMKIK